MLKIEHRADWSCSPASRGGTCRIVAVRTKGTSMRADRRPRSSWAPPTTAPSPGSVATLESVAHTLTTSGEIRWSVVVRRSVRTETGSLRPSGVVPSSAATCWPSTRRCSLTCRPTWLSRGCPRRFRRCSSPEEAPAAPAATAAYSAGASSLSTAVCYARLDVQVGKAHSPPETGGHGPYHQCHQCLVRRPPRDHR